MMKEEASSHSESPSPPSAPVVNALHTPEPDHHTIEDAEVDDEPDEPHVHSSIPIPAKFKGHHPPGTWESRKDEIRRLYLDEARPLKDVRAIMAERGFKATERMYKDRFNRWGFTKKSRKKEPPAKVIKRQARAIHGTPIVGQSSDIVAASSSESQRLVLVRQNTSPASPRSQFMRLPGFYYFQDALHGCFHELGTGERWVERSQRTAFLDNYRTSSLHLAILRLGQAAWLFNEGRYEQGGIISRDAFSQLHLIIEKPSRRALFDLVGILMGWVNSDLTKQLFKYLAAYSLMKAGPQNSLHIVCQSLYNLFQQYPFEECVTILTECLGDEKMGGLIPETGEDFSLDFFQRCVTMAIHTYSAYGQPGRRPDRIQNMYRNPERWIQTNMSRSGMNNDLLRLYNVFATGENTQWQDETVLHLATALYHSTSVSWYKWMCLRSMARFHRSRWGNDAGMGNPRHGLAKRHLEEAIEFADRELAGFSGSVILIEVSDDSKLLEQWHTEAGDLNLAMQVREKREAAIESLVSFYQTNGRLAIRQTIDSIKKDISS